MSEIEKSKIQIAKKLKSLCAHCRSGIKHNCPLQSISARVNAIKGVPLIVNNEFQGLIWR